MFKFNFQKISQVPKNFFRKRPEINNYLKNIKDILKEKNFDFSESFLLLPEEKPNFFKDYNKKFKIIILIGIGGSSLGTKAVFHALKNKKKLNEILFLDTLNPLFLKDTFSKLKLTNLKKGEIAVCLISKSGKTLEVIANFFTLLKEIKKFQPEIFVVTDKNSLLWNFAKKKNWQVLTLPRMVVGRYSLFSNVGLFPLFLAGIHINDLISGAKKINEICLTENPLKNPSLASALTIFYHWRKGKNIYTNFIFPPDLEFFGKWYCQLMAESLGKDKKGLTPAVNIGTTDFHSIGQLYFEGPEDKLTNFVFIEKLGFDFQISEIGDFGQIFPELKGKKIWQLNQAIYEGVKKAFLIKKLPFTETVLPHLDEKNLGILFEMKMIEIMFLAKLMRVNAFNQPGVELYKKEARKILLRR